MNVLIVLAHPEPKSLNGELVEVARNTLQALGHAVRVSDLYSQGFNPVAGKGDFTHELAEPFSLQAEQKKAHESATYSPELAAEMEKLQWADLVIFQFPLWWFSVPAILKGWIDRVLAYGFAYGGKRWFNQGVFSGKRALLSVTIGGKGTSYTEQGLQGDLTNLLRHVWHGSFHFVGISSLAPHPIFLGDCKGQEDIQLRIDQYAARLRGIFEETPFEMDRIEDFDPDQRRLK